VPEWRWPCLAACQCVWLSAALLG